MLKSRASPAIVALLAIVLIAHEAFGDDKLIIEMKKLDQNCLDLLANTTHEPSRCEFYKCFEERFPCGAGGYIMAIGHKYCTKYHPHLSEFTQSGVDLINHMVECLPRCLAEKVYSKRRSIRCRSMRKEAYSLQEKCYMEKIELFCTGMRENRKAFGRSMDITDVLNGEAIGMMKRLSEKCGEKGDILSLAFKYGG